MLVITLILEEAIIIKCIEVILNLNWLIGIWSWWGIVSIWVGVCWSCVINRICNMSWRIICVLTSLFKSRTSFINNYFVSWNCSLFLSLLSVIICKWFWIIIILNFRELFYAGRWDFSTTLVFIYFLFIIFLLTIL